MEYSKVPLRVIYCLILFAASIKCNAQSVVAKEIVTNLYDIEDDSAKAVLRDSSIFIIVTNKNCIKCFNDVCSYFEKNNQEHIKISGIIMMPKNYLELIPAVQKYSDEVRCVQKFLFYFLTSSMPEEIGKMAESPSPQLIIQTKENYRYYSYKETLALTGN